MQERKLKGPIEYIKEAFKIYTKKENFIFFAKIMAVTIIISTFLNLIFRFVYPDYFNNSSPNANPMIFEGFRWTPLFITLLILSVVVFLWTYIVPLIAVINMSKLTEKDVLILSFKNILKMFLLFFVMSVILSFGFLLFIIPGLIFMVWYTYVNFFYFEKKLKLFDSFKQSKALVKGRFWKIFGRNFVFGLFSFLIGLVLSFVPHAGAIVVSFLAPLFILPVYLLYKDLITVA